MGTFTNTTDTCDACQFWNYQGNAPTYATIGGRTLQVAQCRSTDTLAPYAEVQGPFDAVVFTHAENYCNAFTANHDNQLA